MPEPIDDPSVVAARLNVEAANLQVKAARMISKAIKVAAVLIVLGAIVVTILVTYPMPPGQGNEFVVMTFSVFALSVGALVLRGLLMLFD